MNIDKKIAFHLDINLDNVFVRETSSENIIVFSFKYLNTYPRKVF